MANGGVEGLSQDLAKELIVASVEGGQGLDVLSGDGGTVEDKVLSDDLWGDVVVLEDVVYVVKLLEVQGGLVNLLAEWKSVLLEGLGGEEGEGETTEAINQFWH